MIVYFPSAENRQIICKTKMGNFVLIAFAVGLEVFIVTHFAEQPQKDFHT
jgi:hypothetical protein